MKNLSYQNTPQGVEGGDHNRQADSGHTEAAEKLRIHQIILIVLFNEAHVDFYEMLIL
jgi:hypothetical protein